MRKTAMFRVGGSMLGFGLSVVATILDVQQVAPRPIAWQWYTLAGLFVFAGFTLWGWYSTYRHVQQLEGLRPLAELQAHHEGRLAYLALYNRGQHEARFEVEVTLIGTDKGRLFYRGKWRHLRDSVDCSLKSWTSSYIDIIETHGRDNGMEGVNVFSSHETKSAKVPLGGEIHCLIKVASEPPLKQPCEPSYVLLLGKDGNWVDFKQTEMRK